MLEAVFFDLDGTLLDTAPDFDVVLNRLLAQENRPAVPADAIRHHVSHGARALVRLGFGIDEHDPAFDLRLQQLLDAYAQHLDVHTHLFDGLAETLGYLQQMQIPWGVVTNKPDRFTRPVLAGAGLLPQCRSIICPEHVKERKPDPEGLLIACQQVGASQPQRCVYVGDHLRDIQAGINAGMTTVAALYGYIDPAEDPQDWQADHYIHHARELLPLIQHIHTSQEVTHV